jgi:ATP-binding cassette, subfamily B, multidrug efflux pump
MIFGQTINKYYKKYFFRFFIGVLALIMVNYAQLEIPRLTGELIDGLADGTYGQPELLRLISLIAIVGVLITAGRFFWRIGIIGAARRIDYDIRNEMFKKSLILSNDFYSNHKVGGLMAHFINDTQAVRMAIGPGMIMFVDAVFLGSLVLIRMYALSSSLTLLVVIPLSTIAVAGTILGNKMRKRFKTAQKAFEELSDFTQESFSGIAVVKAFVKEGIELREFLKTNQNTKDKNIAYVRLATILQIIVQSVVSLVFILIIIFGAQLILSTEASANPFTVGGLVAFSSYFGLLVWPIMAVTMIIRTRSQGKASLERIDEILYAPVDVYDADDVVEIDTLKGDITFKHLDFQYPDGDELALKNINMDIKAGETVGILGRTGSGKTSIVDLLLRIYNVKRGQLFIDGIDIMQIPLKTLRENFGYVPQDGFLFSDTIKNNITLGLHHDPDIQKVEDVAMMSDVHDNIITFKDGYETIIGERGVTLSGGQKQRVSIARALMKNAPILILDDAVSAVDTATEEKILNNLKKMRQGMTTIMIAHRISTVKYADKIVLIDEGEVIATGDHATLLKTSELYKKMVQQQSLAQDKEVVL